MISISVNDAVEVTLTRTGAARADRCGIPFDRETGALKTQLWALMHDFGDMMGMGTREETPFVENEIGLSRGVVSK